MTASTAPASATSWAATWRRLAPLVPSARRRTVVIGLAGVTGGFLEAALILMVVRLALALSDGAELVTVPLVTGDLEAGFGTVVAVALTTALLRFGVQSGAAHSAASMSAAALHKLGTVLVEGLVRSPWSVRSGDREGHFQEIATNQVRRVAKATLAYGLGLGATLSFAALLLASLTIEPIAAVAMLAVGAGMFLLLRPVSSLARRQSAEESTATVAYAHAVAETVRLGAEIRIFGAGAAVLERVDARLRRVARLHYVSVALSRLVPVLYQSTAMLLIVLGLWGVYLSGTDRVGVAGTIVLILIRALTYAQSGQSYFHEVAQEAPYVDRVADAVDATAHLDARPGRPLTEVEQMRLAAVGYSHGRGAPALDSISIEGRRGELVGIVGPSGAGKTTLAEVLVGLREPQSGVFEINGHPAAEFDRTDWAREVVAVPQSPRLFDGSVAENIRFHRAAIEDERVVAAARAANIHDEIVAFPEGYSTPVGPHADAVSGGQAQRICLARALVGDPSVLVLDEPTSAVDARSEELIRDALVGLRASALVFIVAHRSLTIDACDRIVSIDKGRLVDRGSWAVAP